MTCLVVCAFVSVVLALMLVLGGWKLVLLSLASVVLFCVLLGALMLAAASIRGYYDIVLEDLLNDKGGNNK